MTETDEKLSEAVLRKFLRRHWKMTLVMAVGIVVAAIVAIFTFLKVAADAQALGFVPATLGLWSIGSCFHFFLQVIFWELVFVGSWVIPIVVLIYVLWFRKLPEEERKEYGWSPKSGADPRKTEGGSFFTFLAGLIWLAIVWFSGRWETAFITWTFNDWVYTWLTAFLWMFLIIGIPVILFLIWWVRISTKEES